MAEELPLTGQKIDHYLLEKELGRGTYGVVYLARHDIMDREVAFKLLLPEWVNTPGYIKSFFHEAKLAAQLDHPNVIQAIEARQTDSELCYFVMEYVPGHSIEEIRVSTPELLSLPFILRLSIQLADAMNYAWTTHHLTHGDIKPGNLMIREKDQVLKLADLGLARIESNLNPDEIMATPLYASPELISGQLDKVGPASDVYSFGIMFYELTAGKPPFQGEIEELLQKHLYEEPVPLIEANPDIDRELSDFTGRMIAKNPALRPDWAEVKAFFTAAEKRLFPAPVPKPAPVSVLKPIPAPVPKPAPSPEPAPNEETKTAPVPIQRSAPQPPPKKALPPASAQGSVISIQANSMSSEERAKAWRARLNNVQGHKTQWINWVIILLALGALSFAVFIAYWGSLPQPKVLQYDDEDLGVKQKAPTPKRVVKKASPKKPVAKPAPQKAVAPEKKVAPKK